MHKMVLLFQRKSPKILLYLAKVIKNALETRKNYINNLKHEALKTIKLLLDEQIRSLTHHVYYLIYFYIFQKVFDVTPNNLLCT